MGFLAKLFNLIGPTLLTWLWETIGGAIQKWWAARKARKEVEGANRRAREATEAAESPEQREQSAETTRRNF